MQENPYFEDAGAPLLEQRDNEEVEQDGSYPHKENEHINVVENDDDRIQSEKLRYENADKIYE
jgi:hypothetical protein